MFLIPIGGEIIIAADAALHTHLLVDYNAGPLCYIEHMPRPNKNHNNGLIARLKPLVKAGDDKGFIKELGDGELSRFNKNNALIVVFEAILAARGLSQSHSAMLDACLDKGANIDIGFGYGSMRMVMHATQKGLLEIATHLVNKGANLGLSPGLDEDERLVQQTPLMAALIYNADIPLSLLEKSNVHDEDQKGRTALFYASQSAHVSVMKALLERGAQVNGVDWDGNSILHVLPWGDYQQESKEIMLALLTAGADVTVKNSEGSTPRQRLEEQGSQDEFLFDEVIAQWQALKLQSVTSTCGLSLPRRM